MTKWEYACLTTSSVKDSIVTTEFQHDQFLSVSHSRESSQPWPAYVLFWLNNYGSEGWEVVGVISSSPDSVEYTLKRALP